MEHGASNFCVATKAGGREQWHFFTPKEAQLLAYSQELEHVDDQPRRMAAHDNVNDHATNIVRLSNRLKNQAEQLPDDNGMRPVFLAQTTEAAKHHILRHNSPQQYETTVKSVYDERPTEQKSFTKLTAYLSRTQRTQSCTEVSSIDGVGGQSRHWVNRVHN